MLTASRLYEILNYRPDDDTFRWRALGPSKTPGDIAGGLHSGGHWHIRIEGKLYYAHRLAWLYMTGEWPTRKIRHRNKNRQDNRFANLRMSKPGNTRLRKDR